MRRPAGAGGLRRGLPDRPDLARPIDHRTHQSGHPRPPVRADGEHGSDPFGRRPPTVRIIEDAAQAQGAERWGRRAGSLGDIAATSFYPGKNLGAYGDAGAVITSSEEAADRVRALRNHGGVRKYEHCEFSMNSRLDGIQAAVLSVKLKQLDEWNQERQQVRHGTARCSAASPRIVLPKVSAGNDHVWHLYVVRVPDRDRILGELSEAGIAAGIHYPTPIHLLPAFGFLGHRVGDFPVAERACRGNPVTADLSGYHPGPAGHCRRAALRRAVTFKI